MHISKHLQDLELEVSAGLSLFLSDSLFVCVLTKITVFFPGSVFCRLHNGKTQDKTMKIPVGSARSLHPQKRNSSSCLPYEGSPHTTCSISWVLPHFVPFSWTARSL